MTTTTPAAPWAAFKPAHGAKFVHLACYDFPAAPVQGHDSPVIADEFGAADRACRVAALGITNLSPSPVTEAYRAGR